MPLIRCCLPTCSASWHDFVEQGTLDFLSCSAHTHGSSGPTRVSRQPRCHCVEAGVPCAQASQCTAVASRHCRGNRGAVSCSGIDATLRLVHPEGGLHSDAPACCIRAPGGPRCHQYAATAPASLACLRLRRAEARSLAWCHDLRPVHACAWRGASLQQRRVTCAPAGRTWSVYRITII